MSVTELAHNAILDASCKFAEAAGRCLEGGAHADTDKAIRLLEVSVMAFMVCGRLVACAASHARAQRSEAPVMSTEEGGANTSSSSRRPVPDLGTDEGWAYAANSPP